MHSPCLVQEFSAFDDDINMFSRNQWWPILYVCSRLTTITLRNSALYNAEEVFCAEGQQQTLINFSVVVTTNLGQNFANYHSYFYGYVGSLMVP